MKLPKKQGQRLIPEYLLNYAEELQENHPDPSASWGGSGGDVNIEAGTGITITTESDDTKVISLDTNPNTFEVTATTGMTLEVENQNPLWKDSKLQMSNVGATRLEGTQISLEANNIYLNSDNAPYYVNNTTHEYKTLATTDQLFSGDYDDLYNKPTIPDAVSGTNDGTNWTSLTIGEDTYGLASGGTTYTAGTGIDITGTTISIDNTVALKTDIPTIPTNVSAFTNDAGYITGINSSDVITALGYTPGTSNFSGSYNDLTDKPTIPTEYSYGYGLSTTGSTVSIDTSVVPTLANNNSFEGTNTFKTLQVGAPKANFGLVSTLNSTADDYRRGLIVFQDYDVHQAQLKLSTKNTQATQLNSWYAPVEVNTGSGMDISFKRTNGDSYKLPSKTAATYTIATTDDIPTVPTNISAFNNDSGYITGITSSDVTTALGYTPGTSNFSGDYTDLTNKPDLSIYAQSANLATVATSGSYNDLSNKPTIPDLEDCYCCKTYNVNGYTGNKFTLNSDATYHAGRLVFTQTNYDSNLQKYVGTVTVLYRPYLARSWNAGYKMFTINPTYCSSCISFTTSGVLSETATSGNIANSRYSIDASTGEFTMRDARSSSAGVNCNISTTFPAVFNTDLRTWTD